MTASRKFAADEDTLAKRRLLLRERAGLVGDFFPPDDPLSKFVAAFLLRADELRLLVEKHGELAAEAHSRKDICVRHAIVNTDSTAS